MKKLMLLAALLAMLVVAVVPAIAQVGQETEQDAESGDLEQSSEITGGGDNSIQCVNDQLVGNTGNAQNNVGVLQYASEGSVGVGGGGTITLEPENEFSCTGEVNQAASAAS